MAEQMTLDLGDSEAENKRRKVEEAKAKVRAIAEEVRAEKAKDRKPNKDFGHTRAGGGGGGDFSGMKGLDKPFKKGGKVKKFNDGGMSLEEKYPGAKITRAGPQPKPAAPPETEYSARNREYAEEKAKARVEKDSLAPYERKAPAMGKGGGGGGGGIPKVGSRRPLDMKSGGKVSSASKRADGCAIRGKTRA
jgi:hypothetical protein